MDNTSDLVLVLHGLDGSPWQRRSFFALGLLSYLLTVLVNVTLAVTVCVEKPLHQPIYIFLCNLCLSGLCGASSFYPKLLHDLLADAHVVSYAGCLAQILGIYSYVFCQYTGLTVMAYDRYLAICRPLRYRALMTPRSVARLLAATWTFSVLEAAAGVLLTARLPLCGRRVRKLFCTNWEVVKLSCSDTTLNNVYGFALMFSHLLQAVLILVSYAHLVRASLRSRSDRRKFTQTCLPHLLALFVFTATLVFDIMFSRYGGGGGELKVLHNILAAEFLVVPPLLNPVIYGINLQQIRSRILPSRARRRVAAAAAAILAPGKGTPAASGSRFRLNLWVQGRNRASPRLQETPARRNGSEGPSSASPFHVRSQKQQTPVD